MAFQFFRVDRAVPGPSILCSMSLPASNASYIAFSWLDYSGFIGDHKVQSDHLVGQSFTSNHPSILNVIHLIIFLTSDHPLRSIGDTRSSLDHLTGHRTI